MASRKSSSKKKDTADKGHKTRVVPDVVFHVIFFVCFCIILIVTILALDKNSTLRVLGDRIIELRREKEKEMANMRAAYEDEVAGYELDIRLLEEKIASLKEKQAEKNASGK